MVYYLYGLVYIIDMNKQATNENAKIGQKLVKEFGLYGVSGSPESFEVTEVLDMDAFGFYKVKVKPLFEVEEKKRQKIEGRTYPITEFDV
jgi:hypothetical protein